MQKLNGSLQQLLQNMGNSNYDVNTNNINNTNNDDNDTIDDVKIDTFKNIKPSKAKHSKKRSNSAKKKKTPSIWQFDEDKSLREDVKLYVISCAVKVEDFTNEDWKSIAKMHNDNFWRDTKYKGRSYKDCRSQNGKPALTESDTNNDMNGEIEQTSGSDDSNQLSTTYTNNKNNDIPIITSTDANVGGDDDDSDTSSDDDVNGLLSKMQAPPQ